MNDKEAVTLNDNDNGRIPKIILTNALQIFDISQY